MPKIIKVPGELRCPITHQLFKEPVIAADGQAYEREAIERWLQDHDTSPLTGTKLEHKRLLSAIFVQEKIENFFQEFKPCSQEEFFIAVRNGEIEVIKNLTFLDSYLESKDSLGMTALHWAACGTNEDLVKLLIDLGARVCPQLG